MILLYILLVFLTLYGISYNRNGWYNNYMGKDQHNAIKGLCIILVFIRHIFQYINASGYEYTILGDHYADILDGMSRQMLVAFFLFSSGYGIMESIRNKDNEYINIIPKRRILNTLVNFDIAVFAFIILDILIGESLSIEQVALSAVAWESVGNSNWYIFAILCCYLIVYVSFKCSHQIINKNIPLYIVIFLFVAYIFIISNYKTSCWYDTILCYPAGMIYSTHKKMIETYIKKYYICFLLLTLLVIASLYYAPEYKGVIHNTYSISLCFFIAALTMKVRIGNSVIYWLGANLFPLYIYQRLPMISLSIINKGEFIRDHVILYIIICALIVTLISYLYRFWQIKIK